MTEEAATAGSLGRAAGLLAVSAVVGIALAWWVAPTPTPQESPPELVLSRHRQQDQPAPASPDGRPWPNLLVLLADDVGQDMVGAYGVHPSPPATPNLDALAAAGLRFDQAIANPVCSPTRATLLTGRYAWRYDLGRAIPPREGWDLPLSERTLAQALSEGTDGAYTSVVVGKWHLATPDRGGYEHALRLGFDHHVGTMGNLIGFLPGTEVPQTYNRWSRVVDGRHGPAKGYVTSTTIDDALYLARELPEPWFMLVAFHAAHFPVHQPPDELYTTPLSEEPTDTELYRAMVEALDTEIGRLLSGMPGEVSARTNVLFLGDNGSAPVGVTEPWPKSQSKGALTRGGIRVPFILSGPSVEAVGQHTEALVNTTDLYATMLDLVGLDEAPPEDSISFAPTLSDPTVSEREYAYAEHFSPNGPGPKEEWEAAIRDQRHKLVVYDRMMVELYDLEQDPMETRSLLVGDLDPETRAVMRRLKAALPEPLATVRRGERPAEE